MGRLLDEDEVLAEIDRHKAWIEEHYEEKGIEDGFVKMYLLAHDHLKETIQVKVPTAENTCEITRTANESKFKPGDKFIIELGEERKMFDEFEIAGTDLYVRTDLLEKLTPYTPEIKFDEWCTDCKEYDHERNYCPRWNRVIRETLKDTEIIHCRDCKFSRMTYDGDVKYCDIWFPDEACYIGGDHFCASAERREE